MTLCCELSDMVTSTSMETPGVDFINVLWAAFAQVDLC